MDEPIAPAPITTTSARPTITTATGVGWPGISRCGAPGGVTGRAGGRDQSTFDLEGRAAASAARVATTLAPRPAAALGWVEMERSSDGGTSGPAPPLAQRTHRGHAARRALVGGVTLAALAGARRSASSLQRFEEASRSSNFQFSVSKATPAQLAKLRSAPGVDGVGARRSALRRADILRGSSPPDRGHDRPEAGVPRSIDPQVVALGRLANPSAVDEINIGEGLAQRDHLGIGDVIDTMSMTKKGFVALQHGAPFRFDGPRPKLHIVGIIRRPLDLASLGSAGGVLLMTPAFDHSVSRNLIANPAGYTIRVRASDPERANRSIEQVFGKDPAFQPQSLTSESSGARDAINVLTDVLLIFAAVTAIAGVRLPIAIVLKPVSSRRRGWTRRRSTRSGSPACSGRLMTMSGRVLVMRGRWRAGWRSIGKHRRLAPPVTVRWWPAASTPTLAYTLDWFVLGLGALGLIFAIVLVGIAGGPRHCTPPDCAARDRSGPCKGHAWRAPVGHRWAAPVPHPPATAWPSADGGRTQGGPNVPSRFDPAVFGVAFGSVGVVRPARVRLEPRPALVDAPALRLRIRSPSPTGDQGVTTATSNATIGVSAVRLLGIEVGRDGLPMRRCSSPATPRPAGSSSR